jgi:hypothetical protein
VVRAYSMQGFDLRFGGGILEMRTEGERTAAAGRDPGRAFEHFLASEPVQGVLFDVRGAYYKLEPVQWGIRIRTIARLCSNRAMAVIARDDQTPSVAQLLLVHDDPLPFQHDMDASVAETPAFAGDLLHGLTQFPIVWPNASVSNA